MYTVIHSTNPFLFARLSTELMMEGFGRNSWSRLFSPFTNGLDSLVIGKSGWFHFTNAPEMYSKKRITLTEENYLDTLEFLINNKAK